MQKQNRILNRWNHCLRKEMISAYDQPKALSTYPGEGSQTWADPRYLQQKKNDLSNWNLDEEKHVEKITEHHLKR